MLKRRSKDNYYLDMAEVASSRSTCLRRQFGAVVVKDDEILATGYNGAPRGRKNCHDLGVCRREELNVPRGTRYELCRSVHAEANALLSAARASVIGATLYLAGKEVSTGECVVNAQPCAMCKRLIINAGIVRVVTRSTQDECIIFDVYDWIENDDSIGEEAGY